MSLIQFVEYVLLSGANRALERRARPGPAPESPAPTIPADHVVLGHVLPRCPEVVSLSPAARLRHLYVLGATGTGKTNLLLRLIESDMQAGRTFCVVDLRGDLTDRVLLRLARQGPPEGMADRLTLLDLRQDEFAVGFNPLAGSGDSHSRAFHVLSVLRQQTDSWGVQLEETLRNALVALAEAGRSLLEVEPLLSHPAFRRETLRCVGDRSVRAFFDRYGRLSEDKQVGWRLPVLNKVTPLLASPPLRRLFGQRRSFDLRALLDGPPGRILLVSLAVDRLHQSAHLAGGLLVSALQTAIMARVGQPEKERNPVHLYIDEFETMATEQFQAIVAEGRRFGLGLCLSHQNLGQLPAGLRQALLNNVHTQLYFQTGAGDAADLAREIVGPEAPEEVRRILMTQGVGEAYLVLRGRPATRLRVPHCPDPPAEASAVQALREASLRRHGRPSAEVEAEMAAWEDGLHGERAAPSDTGEGPSQTEQASPAGDNSAEAAAVPAARKARVADKGTHKTNDKKEVTYEVRHRPARSKFARPSQQDAKEAAEPDGG